MAAKKRKWVQGELSDIEPKKQEVQRTNYRDQFLTLIKGKDKSSGITN
jgi:hypothetical protein